jgi:glycerophosphoryl diester phosphodiesterase
MNFQNQLMAAALFLGLASCSYEGVSETSEDFTVFAHRGASGYELENTIASFHKAVELGASAIELDVFRCASGEVVVFHDESLARLSSFSDSIEQMTLNQIREIELN